MCKVFGKYYTYEVEVENYKVDKPLSDIDDETHLNMAPAPLGLNSSILEVFLHHFKSWWFKHKLPLN